MLSRLIIPVEKMELLIRLQPFFLPYKSYYNLYDLKIYNNIIKPYGHIIRPLLFDYNSVDRGLFKMILWWKSVVSFEISNYGQIKIFAWHPSNHYNYITTYDIELAVLKLLTWQEGL